MSLLRLPPEILLRIFEQIGPEFFHEDLSRLSICRGWFEFALPACFSSITLLPETLRRLVTSGATKRPHSLIDHLQTLEIELRGFQPHNSTLYSQEESPELFTLERAASTEVSRSSSAIAWEVALNNDLDQLANLIRRSRKLRVLHMSARSSPPSDALDSPKEYLSIPIMQAFLSVESLSVLVLDLSVGFLESPETQGECSHICPAIGRLLPTLRTLHLRMRAICPDVLNLQDSFDSLQLSVVILNLSLMANVPGTTSASHSKRCHSQVGGLPQLKSDLQGRAEALAKHMASPKTMRILTHSLPHFEVQTYDILSGTTKILDEDMAWDEDGRTVKEDSEPESEILDDDDDASISS